MHSSARWSWSVPLLLALAACGPDPAPTPTTTSTGPGAGGPASTVTVRKSSVSWTAPSTFELVPSPSQMRLATYRVARAEGDSADAEMTVSQVGGGAKQNLDRWKGQVQDAKERESSETTVGELKVSVIWLEGTFVGMAMGPGAAPPAAQDGYALLGAVVEWPGHGEPHFFKLTGPKKTVEAARPAFDELIQSLSPNG